MNSKVIFLRFIIQNYNLLNKSCTVTPRLRFLFTWNYLFFFCMFYKNLFFYTSLSLSTSHFKFSIFFICYRYFYFKQLTFFFKKLNLNLTGFYTNNVIKATIFKIFYFFNFFINPSQSYKFFLYWKSQKTHPQLVKNLTFFSFKTAAFQVCHTINNFFYFFLLFFSLIFWFQPINLFKFYLNFLLINSNLAITTIYRGFFFSVYSF